MYLSEALSHAALIKKKKNKTVYTDNTEVPVV